MVVFKEYNWPTFADFRIFNEGSKHLYTFQVHLLGLLGQHIFSGGYVEPKVATLNPECAVFPQDIDPLNLPVKPKGCCSKEKIPG